LVNYYRKTHLPPSFFDRFINSIGEVIDGKEGAIQYIEYAAAQAQAMGNKPFFMVLSLINPHDVLFQPQQFDASGYPPEYLQGDVPLPPTLNESLATKPTSQSQYLTIGLQAGVTPSTPEQQYGYMYVHAHVCVCVSVCVCVYEYVCVRVSVYVCVCVCVLKGNGIQAPEALDWDRLVALHSPTPFPFPLSQFYANLMKHVDAYVVQTLDKLQATGLLDNTLIINTADHGELGLSHGGQIQKDFNVYEQTLRVPLTFSNPKLFPQPLQSEQLVSLVDLLPTLATLLQLPRSAYPKKHKWAGVDFSSVVLNPAKAKPVQDYTVFTFDDYTSGQPYVAPQIGKLGPWVLEPAHLIGIREKRWKIAMHYDPSEAISGTPRQWEFYDMQTDPNGESERRSVCVDEKGGGRWSKSQPSRLGDLHLSSCSPIYI
jgi:hypothetical protein